MMAMIGDFAFDIKTNEFDRLSRKLSYNYAEFPKAKWYESSQSVGKDTEEVTVSGSLTTIRSGLKPLADLEAIAALKEAVPFIMGYGEVMGDFKITKIDEDRSQFLDDGRSVFVEFSVDLKRVRT